ncbi:MAG: ELWxxDGT repeat protein [Anaerolineae bacterium]
MKRLIQMATVLPAAAMLLGAALLTVRAGGGGETVRLVKDIRPGAKGSSPLDFTRIGTAFVMFGAIDEAGGRELWRSDGTPTGTVIVKDIWPGPDWAWPDPFAHVGDILFVGATDGVSGRELWRSDGTPTGTFMVKDIFPGPGWSWPEDFAVMGGRLFFSANDGTYGPELWASNGTPTGTVMVKDTYPGAQPDNYPYPHSFTSVGERLFFSANDGTSGYELWVSDGTPTGTVLVKDIKVGAGSSSPEHLTGIGEALYFTADDGIRGQELWHSDGTPTGTVMVKDISPGATSTSVAEQIYPPSPPFVFLSGEVFFIADSGNNVWELWKSDGTATGTVMVKDIWPGGAPGCQGSVVFCPAMLIEVGGRLYFPGYDEAHGVELWKSDGTATSTVVVKDIYPGPYGAWPENLTVINGRLFFSADDGARGIELWVSNGLDSGTVLVADINPGPEDSWPGILTLVGGNLFFGADDGVHGHELWAMSLLKKFYLPLVLRH